MTEAPTPATERCWQLTTDDRIQVNVRIDDDNWAAGDTITITDEHGRIEIPRTSVDELIAVLRQARDAR